MKVRRGNIHPHNEPPAVLLVDIAFNLLIFFVVCASTQPTSGRRQDIPGSETKTAATPQKNETIDVALTRTTATINGDRVRPPEFVGRLNEVLKAALLPSKHRIGRRQEQRTTRPMNVGSTSPVGSKRPGGRDYVARSRVAYEVPGAID